MGQRPRVTTWTRLDVGYGLQFSIDSPAGASFLPDCVSKRSFQAVRVEWVGEDATRILLGWSRFPSALEMDVLEFEVYVYGEKNNRFRIACSFVWPFNFYQRQGDEEEYMHK